MRLDPEELLRSCGTITRWGPRSCSGLMGIWRSPRAIGWSCTLGIRRPTKTTHAAPCTRDWAWWRGWRSSTDTAPRQGYAAGGAGGDSHRGRGGGRHGTRRAAPLVVGNTPTIAAQMQDLAASGTVVISPATLRLVEGYFDYQALGAHMLEDLAEPLTVYRILQEKLPRADSRSRSREG